MGRFQKVKFCNCPLFHIFSMFTLKRLFNLSTKSWPILALKQPNNLPDIIARGIIENLTAQLYPKSLVFCRTPAKKCKQFKIKVAKTSRQSSANRELRPYLDSVRIKMFCLTRLMYSSFSENIFVIILSFLPLLQVGITACFPAFGSTLLLIYTPNYCKIFSPGSLGFSPQ